MVWVFRLGLVLGWAILRIVASFSFALENNPFVCHAGFTTSPVEERCTLAVKAAGGRRADPVLVVDGCGQGGRRMRSGSEEILVQTQTRRMRGEARSALGSRGVSRRLPVCTPGEACDDTPKGSSQDCISLGYTKERAS